MHHRREFLRGSGALLTGLCFAPAAMARRDRLGDILAWSPVSGSARAVVHIALGGNALLIVSAGEAMVVDSKFPYLGEALRADAASAAGSVSLLNTHHHGDHTGGNSAFVGKGRSYAHPKAIERIGGQIDSYRAGAQAAVAQASENLRGNRRALEMAVRVAENAANLSAEGFIPTDAVEGGSRINVGNLTLDIHHFGAGHTDNDLVVHLTDENVIHTGDLVFSGLHPFFDAGGGVDANGWVRSLTSALALCDEDTVVVPGHGKVGGREIVERQRDYIERLVEVVGAEIKKGTPRTEAVELAWPFMDGLGFEQAKGRAIGVVYDQLGGP